MFTTTVTVGFTREVPGYIPALEGWKPGAAQDIVDLRVSISSVDGIGGLPLRDVAELIAEVASNPDRTDWTGVQGAHAVKEAQDLARLAGVPVRPITVGDTVTVAGRTLACQPLGLLQEAWIDVTDQLAAARQAAAAQAG